MAVRIRRVSTITAAVAASAAFVFAAGAASRDTALPTLHVAYATDCAFTISDDAERLLNAASKIAPGGYRIEVSTPVSFSDFTTCPGPVQFQLTGPGVNLHTTLDNGANVDDLLSATFGANATYTAQDNRQPAATRIVFGTRADPEPETATVPAATASMARGTLTAMLRANGTLALTTKKGKPFVRIKAGLYRFVITDRNSKRAVALVHVGGKTKRLSGVRFVGRTAKGVTLEPGRWKYTSGPGHVRTFLVVA